MQAHRPLHFARHIALLVAAGAFAISSAHAGLLGGGGGSLGGSLHGSLNGALRSDPNRGQPLRKLTDETRTLKDGVTDKAREGATTAKTQGKDGAAGLQDQLNQGGDKLQAPAVGTEANGAGSGQASGLIGKAEDKPAAAPTPAAATTPATPATPAATTPTPAKERALTGSASGSGTANGQASASRQGVSARADASGRGEGSARLQR